MQGSLGKACASLVAWLALDQRTDLLDEAGPGAGAVSDGRAAGLAAC